MGFNPAGLTLGHLLQLVVKVAEREGFEPFCRFEAKSLENADLIDG
jgi:hypothetical protein